MGRPSVVAVYGLDDSDDDIAVVRCPAGDVDTFWRLTVQHIREHEILFTEDRGGWTEREWMAVTKACIHPPQWQWCRKNPPAGHDRGEHPWILGHPDGPGPGNWQGALVRIVAHDDTIVEARITRGIIQPDQRNLVSVA